MDNEVVAIDKRMNETEKQSFKDVDLFFASYTQALRIAVAMSKLPLVNAILAE